MKELNNFFEAKIIDLELHNKTIGNESFNKLTQKINKSEYVKLINQAYWLSFTLYKISITSYIEHLNEENNFLDNQSILVFYPFSTLASEICNILKNEYIYTSLLSVLARQIIEQICLTKEVQNEKIKNLEIVKALIECHNIHVGSASLNMDDLNKENEGLLKVFKTKRKYGNLAKKYDYSFLYKFYSGDIHHISTIEKIIPQYFSKSDDYNKAYLKTYIGLLRNTLLFVNSFCNKLSNDDLKKLDDYDFVIVNC